MDMEEKLDELIKSINNLSSFSPNDFINILALIGSWITIFILLKEKFDKNRPYLQLSFELIRSNLACIVVRNVGEVPLVITSIKFNKEFTDQLPNDEKENLANNKITDLKIYPNRQWIFCLGVIIPDILEKFKVKEVKIEYSYKKIGKKKTYTESTKIDFSQYSKMLVYISDINELKKVNEQIVKNSENINKNLNDIKTSIVQYQNVNDKVTKSIVNGYTKKSK